VPDERRDDLRRTYLSLGTGELVTAAVFAGVAAGAVAPRLQGPHDALALWSALVPLLVILVQAGVYWLAARTWVRRTTMPTHLASVYSTFRVLDPVLLAAGLLGVLVWLPSAPGAAVLVLGVWAFGVVEYANYFVVRLAYPLREIRKIAERRTPRLVADLSAAS
jgi:hypothetical protein